MLCGCKLNTVSKNGFRFSDMLCNTSNMPSNTNSQHNHPTDWLVHRAAIHTMATCHSLRLVDGELVGDPLDLKMFAFTGWSFCESQKMTFAVQDKEYRMLNVSVAKPPSGMEVDPVDAAESVSVGPGTDIAVIAANLHQSSITELSIIKGFDFVSQLRRASVIVNQGSALNSEIYVKGAPECMKDICRPESCKMTALIS